MTTKLNEYDNISLTDIFSHKKSFDITYILTIIYIWIMFNYFTPIHHKTLKDNIQNNIYFMYFSIYLFILLFYLTEDDKTLPLLILIYKSVFAFSLVVLIIHVAFFIKIFVIFLLIIYHLIKYHIDHIHNYNIADKNYKFYLIAEKYINILILITIIVGFLYEIYIISFKK